MGFLRDVKAKMTSDSTHARGLQKGTHSENCERCKHSVRNPKSSTGLTCTHHQEHVPADGKCALFTR